MFNGEVDLSPEFIMLQWGPSPNYWQGLDGRWSWAQERKALADLEDLQADIISHGILNPVTLGTRFVIDGDHRILVAERLGIQVPCTIVDESEIHRGRQLVAALLVVVMMSGVPVHQRGRERERVQRVPVQCQARDPRRTPISK